MNIMLKIKQTTSTFPKNTTLISNFKYNKFILILIILNFN